jgi:hypothetical protein
MTSRRRIVGLGVLVVAVGAVAVVVLSAGTAGSASKQLAFLNAPADAQSGNVISSKRFDPAGTPVRVAVVGSDGTVIPTNAGSITLSAGSNDSLLHGTKTQPVVNGIATFGDLSIDQTGTYNLTATSGSLTPVTSDPFAIVTLGVLCKKGATTCTGTVPGPTTTGVKASSISDGTTLGVTTLGSSALPAGVCGSAFTPLGTGANVDIRPTPGLTEITFTWSKELVMISPNNGASFYNSCIGTDHTFTTKSGAAATFQDGRYWGLLPDGPN